MFHLLATLAVILCQLLILTFIVEAIRHDWRWIRRDGLTIYNDAAKTIITASGIAVAIVAAGIGGRLAAPFWILQRAVVCLIVCILSSVMFMIAMARGWERASSRETNQSENPFDQGRLSWLELLTILFFGDLALSSFFLGFIYLGRTMFSVFGTSSPVPCY